MATIGIILWGFIVLDFLIVGKAWTQVLPPTGALSDAELLRIAVTAYDRRDLANTRQILGIYKGLRVLADYPCGDICPNYTVRIIHFDVALEDCDRTGGVVKTMSISRGIASRSENYCVPKIIAENWEKYIR
jgi:hypothetical protein